ncbi:MAG: hypothetical protein V5A68_04860 [Candidatus Thermoplasmatota archaeon]
MRILVVARRMYFKESQRGINVITSTFVEQGDKVDFLRVRPLSSFLNSEFYKLWFSGEKKDRVVTYAYPELFNRGSITGSFENNFFDFLKNLRLVKLSKIDLEDYDFVVLESGEAILNLDLIPSEKLIYRQSDPVELILSDNQRLIEIERRLIDKARLTLVANEKIYNFYQQNLPDLTKNMEVWRNGFLINETIDMKNPYEEGSVNGVYFGINSIDWATVKILVENNKDINFYVIGLKPDSCPLKEYDNLKLCGFIPHGEALKYLKYADFVFLPFSKKDISSSKYQYQSVPSGKFNIFMYYKLPTVTYDYGRLKEYEQFGFYTAKNREEFIEKFNFLKDKGFEKKEYDVDLENFQIENRKKDLINIFRKYGIKKISPFSFRF